MLSAGRVFMALMRTAGGVTGRCCGAADTVAAAADVAPSWHNTRRFLPPVAARPFSRRQYRSSSRSKSSTSTRRAVAAAAATRSEAVGDAGGPAVAAAAAHARRLAAEFGVWLQPGVDVASTPPYGLGLVFTRPIGGGDGSSNGGPAAAAPAAVRKAGANSNKGPPTPLIRVPLDLVLSHAIPGCCPAARAAPELQALLADDQVPWEVQIAGLVLWASAPAPAPAPAAASGDRQQPEPRERRFWREYAARVLPPSDELASLLLWSDAELRWLQDAEAAASARRWRAEVRAAHAAHFAPGAHAAALGVTLDRLLWAVAGVESRAFGTVMGGAGGGEARNAAVPFLDLANHAAAAPTSHGVVDCRTGGGADRGGSSTQAVFELRADAGASYAAGEQLLISYGEKDSRRLIDQYGFVVEGNAADWHAASRAVAAALPPGVPRVASRDALAAAANALAAADGATPARQRRLQTAASALAAAIGWRSLADMRDAAPGAALRCLSAAEAALRAQLAAFPTTAAEDAAELRALREAAAGELDCDGGDDGSPSEDARRRRQRQKRRRLEAALRYRLERKLLAQSQLDVLAEVRAAGRPV